MPTTTDPSDNSGERHQRSRLEAEIDEILERAQRENPLPPPIPFERPRRNRIQEVVNSSRFKEMHVTTRQWLTAVPLIVAYMFAVLAHIFSSFSSPLAHIAVSLAVIAVFWPIVERARSKQNTPSSQMWRGRDMSAPPPEHPGPTPWEQFRKWLRDRRLLP